MKITSIYIVSLFLLFFAIPIHAQNKNNNIEWTLNDAHLIQALALLPEVNKPKEMTQLLRDTQFHITKDTVIMRKKVINFFPRFVDIENHGSRSIYYNPHYQHLRIIAAASVTPEGKIKQIDPDTIQVLNTSEYNTFNSEKEAVFAVPGLTKGSVSVLEYELITRRKLMESDWSEEMYTQGNYPISQLKLKVTWKDSEFVKWTNDSERIQCEKTEDALMCKGNNLPAYQSDYQSYWRDQISRISLGSFISWDQVIDKTSTAMAKADRNTEGLTPLYKSLTKNTLSVEASIANILDFVSRGIRYVSMSEYGHAMTPHTIAETIENRFGDCKDKSVLLKALLEKTGVEAKLVLVSTQRTDSSKLLVPTMNAYNHVVVCFKLEGKEYCVDPTDTQTHWRHTPSWIQNKIILPLEPGYIPHQMEESRYRWRMNTDTSIVFDEQGGQQESQTRTYWGEYASVFRASLYEDNDAKRQESLLKQYQKVVSDLAEPKFRVENIDSMTEDLTIYSDATLSPFLEIGEPLVYTENDAWIRDELSELRLSNEHYPEHFPGVSMVSEFTYDTNGLWTITELPPTLNFNHVFGSMKRTVERLSEGKLLVRTTLKLRANTIKPSDIEKFNALLNTYITESAIRFYGAPVNKT